MMLRMILLSTVFEVLDNKRSYLTNTKSVRCWEEARSDPFELPCEEKPVKFAR